MRKVGQRRKKIALILPVNALLMMDDDAAARHSLVYRSQKAVHGQHVDKKDRCLQEIENSKRTFHNEHYETMCKEMLPNFHACRTKRDFKETVWLACNGRPGIGARGRKEDD